MIEIKGSDSHDVKILELQELEGELPLHII
jgi:hypothetical protein